MAEPKKKLSKTRTNNRRANYRVDLPAVTVCSNCKEAILPHRICPHCGYYKGKSQISSTPAQRIVLDSNEPK